MKNIQMKRHNRAQGFTLIELMIVVAIIGILAAVALPAYSDYTVRAQVSECSSIVNGLKPQVKEYYEQRGVYPTMDQLFGVGQSGSLPTDHAGTYVSQVAITPIGANPGAGAGAAAIAAAIGVDMTCTFSSQGNFKANAAIDTATLNIYSAQNDNNPGNVTWVCGTATIPGGGGAGNFVTAAGAPALSTVPLKFLSASCKP